MSSQDEEFTMRGFDSFESKLGDELRGERATLGKSLLDVQRRLRIKAAYIAAIEDCDPDVFPNKGFIAGYVRSYGRYLGLDADEIFDRFCEESGFSGVNAGLSPRGGAKSDRKNGQSISTAPDISFKPFNQHANTGKFPVGELSPSAIGSFLVLIALIVGLVFGGIRVLDNIQRVEISPLDQRPGALSEVAGIVAPGLDTEEVLREDNKGEQKFTRLYQPRELEVPVLISRDGPILDINPDASSVFGSTTRGQESDGLIDEGFRNALLSQEPIVREEIVAPSITVIAQRPAWVRVYNKDGTIFFEKILDSGEHYVVPESANVPLLRAGNAGSVFVLIDNEVFGPVGNGASVAKNVSLAPDDIRSSQKAVTEIPKVILSSVSEMAVREN